MLLNFHTSYIKTYFLEISKLSLLLCDSFMMIFFPLGRVALHDSSCDDIAEGVSWLLRPATS